MTGSFTVIAGEFVTNLHGKLTNSVETSCGTGTIAVPGKIKIIHGTGEDSYGPFDLYAAGTINTTRDPIVQPLRMVVIHNGKRVTGSVELSFVWPPKKGYLTGGEINYGNCSVSLAFLHG
jgi:hypothetical protein